MAKRDMMLSQMFTTWTEYTTESTFATIYGIFHGSGGHAGVEGLVLLHMPFPSVAAIDLFATLWTPVGVIEAFIFGEAFWQIWQRAGIACRASGSAVVGVCTIDRRYERAC